MSSPGKPKRYFIPNFEARSMLLVTAVTFGGIAGAQGQTTAPSPSTSASAAAEIIPANKGSTSGVYTAFDRANTNKDGKVSRAEAEDLTVPQRFEQIDTNRDTFISREELAKFSGSWQTSSPLGLKRGGHQAHTNQIKAFVAQVQSG